MAERSDSLRLLILDVGTSSMRGTLTDGQGRQLDQVQIHYQPSYFSDGRVEQSPDDWLDAMDRISKHYAARDANRCDRTDFTTIFRHSCRRAGIAASPGDHVAGRPQPRDLY